MHRSDRKFYFIFLIKVNTCSIVKGASILTVFRGKSGIEKYLHNYDNFGNLSFFFLIYK